MVVVTQTGLRLQASLQTPPLYWVERQNLPMDSQQKLCCQQPAASSRGIWGRGAGRIAV